MKVRAAMQTTMKLLQTRFDHRFDLRGPEPGNPGVQYATVPPSATI